jgi:atypical dual specificity phosphatase
MAIPRWLARGLYWPTLGWNMLLGRTLKVRHWWDQIEPGLYLGAVPLRHDVEKLSALGVRRVVNTCEEFEGWPSLYEQHRIEQLWIPTTDFNPPSLTQIDQAVGFIAEAIEENKAVYVHCKAGRARSATVVICYLMKQHQIDPLTAQQKIQAKRPHVLPVIYRRDVVQQFHRRLRDSTDGTSKTR